MGMEYHVKEGDTVQMPLTEAVMLSLLDCVFAAAKCLGYTNIRFSVVRGEDHWERVHDAPPPEGGV